MPNDSAPDVQPTASLRRAVQAGAVAFLRSHPALRFVVGAIGTVLFVIGMVAAPFWEVPLLSWLSGGQVAATCLAGGLGALGIWYVSGRGAPASPNRRSRGSNDSPRQLDLVNQLKQLKELHATGVLTDEEFERAKSRALE